MNDPQQQKPADNGVGSTGGSARLTWECTNHSLDFVWALGERVERVGKPARVENVVAFVERTASGNWRWLAYVGGGSEWGLEPSCDYAMAAAERVLPNNAICSTELSHNTQNAG